MLTWQNPVINISVAQYNGSSQIRIASTVGGQMNDWGVTKKTIQDYGHIFAPSGSKLSSAHPVKN